MCRYGRPNRSHRRDSLQHRRLVAHDEVSVEDARGHRSLHDWDQDDLGSRESSRANLGNGWLRRGEYTLRLTQDRRVPEMVSTATPATTASTVLRWSDESSEESSERNELDERAWWACTTTLRYELAQYAGHCHLNQDVDAERIRYACRLGWEFEGSHDEGSQAIQAPPGLAVSRRDGFIGPETISALQQHIRFRGHDLEVDGDRELPRWSAASCLTARSGDDKKEGRHDRRWLTPTLT